MTIVSVLVDTTVVGSAAGSLIWRRGAPGSGGRRRWWTAGGPEAALALVVGLILLNEVLVSVYVLRVHGGDPSFVTRYLAPGWFETDRGSLIRRLAAAWPAPGLLAPSVLRVQATLELPFGLLAYLSALRWLDAGLYRRVARSPLLGCAAVAYTVVFCAVEWFFHSPYTAWDIGLRLVSAVLTPLWIAAMAGREQEAAAEAGRASSAAELLLFCGAAGALGYLVLVLYGTVLLYNLGLLGHQLPGAAVALVVLVGCRTLARRLRPSAPPGPAVAAMGSGLRWFLVLFFAPALAVRYAVNFGTPWVALGAVAVLALTAAWLALRATASVRLLLTLAGAAVLGLLAGYAAVSAVTDAYYEATALRGFAVFVLTVLAACLLADRLSGGSGGSGAANAAGRALPPW
ncbi:hypothetical protein ACEZDB_01945 [Streptacidiphilus sp. N1-3]|uniref:Integral membrane protein n=1 Tax=Streptacidiphilus alkalitolerans TaxID=3342712 RepID=A0ABV6WTR3_9ACTN